MGKTGSVKLTSLSTIKDYLKLAIFQDCFTNSFLHCSSAAL